VVISAQWVLLNFWLWIESNGSRGNPCAHASTWGPPFLHNEMCAHSFSLLPSAGMHIHSLSIKYIHCVWSAVIYARSPEQWPTTAAAWECANAAAVNMNALSTIPAVAILFYPMGIVCEHQTGKKMPGGRTRFVLINFNCWSPPHYSSALSIVCIISTANYD
jgi:hypothetical protein